MSRQPLLARLSGTLREAVVPPPGSARIACSALADAVGSGLFMSGSAIYFSQRLELGTVAIGGGFAVAGVIALVTTAPLGVLADRFGYQRFLWIAHLARAAIYPLYLLIGGVVAFTLVITLLTVADRVASPALSAEPKLWGMCEPCATQVSRSARC